jgi:hypothetical protein
MFGAVGVELPLDVCFRPRVMARAMHTQITETAVGSTTEVTPMAMAGLRSCNFCIINIVASTTFASGAESTTSISTALIRSSQLIVVVAIVSNW